MKKVLITNKVTSHFFITPAKPITCTSFSHLTDFSRLKVAEKTREKHVLHIVRLYEQLRQKKATSNEMAFTLGLYVKRWQR